MEKINYGSPSGYVDPEVYIGRRYQNLGGRIRLSQEFRIFDRFLEYTHAGEKLLDCPHGTGRLQEYFNKNSLEVTGFDLSVEMLSFARKNFDSKKLVCGIAESLPLKTSSVDWVFSFALMKHLPPGQQFEVLHEFSRVAKRGFLVSFAVWNPLTYSRWWLMQRRENFESFPIPESWITWITKKFGLNIIWGQQVIPILGMEKVYLFKKDR